MSDAFPPPPPEQPQPAGQAPQPPPTPWARGPWAAPAAPAGKQRTGLIVTLAVGGALVLAGAVVTLVYALLQSASDSVALPPERSDAPSSTPYAEEEADEEEPEPEYGATEPDAAEDVTITKCTRDSLIGWPHADLKIVNGSGSAAGYVVFVKFVDADGAVVTDGIATTEDLAPGESAKVRAQGLGEVPAGTRCRVEAVQRDPM